jgi:hypothetical protein
MKPVIEFVMNRSRTAELREKAFKFTKRLEQRAFSEANELRSCL